MAFECMFDPKNQASNSQFNIRAYFDLAENVPVEKLYDHQWLLQKLTPQFDDKVHLLVSFPKEARKKQA